MATRANPKQAKTVGDPGQKSAAKARTAADRTVEQVATVDSEAWPRGVNGQPMMKIVMTASELIPTGQFANVSVGPAQITAFIDQDRQLDPDEAYFSEHQREAMAQALNELAEIVEADVVAVQRNLVLESLQESVGQNGN